MVEGGSQGLDLKFGGSSTNFARCNQLNQIFDRVLLVDIGLNFLWTVSLAVVLLSGYMLVYMLEKRFMNNT